MNLDTNELSGTWLTVGYFGEKVMYAAAVVCVQHSHLAAYANVL